MANLSNINGKFVVEQTTGFVGIGTTDPGFLIEAAGTNAELALNASSIYRIRSTASDEFIITKNGVGDRLTISGGGDAIFGGNVEIGLADGGEKKLRIHGGATGSSEGGQIELHTAADYDTTYAFYRIDAYQDDLRIGRTGTTDITLDSSGNTLFAGNITFGAVNPFQQTTNVLDGTGTDGARIRSAVSSAANPTFSNSDDADTGMFFAAADTLGFTTGGTEKMRITSSAEGHIELSGTAPVIKATASNGGSGLRINVAAQSSGQIFRVQEDGTTLFQIDDGGLVTFAGTITISEYIVHSGDTDTYFGFPAADEYKVTVGGSSKIFADANAAYLYYQGNQKLVTTANGVNIVDSELGIGAGHGTSSAGNAIVFAPYGLGTNIAGGELQFYGGRSTGNAAGGSIKFYTSPAGSSGSSANAHTEKMRITSGGDIIVSGGDLFLNSGTSYNDKGVVYFSNERTAIISDIVNLTANGDTSLDFQTRSGGARASSIFIDEFRKVGIGTTSPSSFNSRGRNLVVAGSGDVGISIDSASTGSGTILFADGTGGTAAYRGIIEYDHANDSMAFSTAASEAMRIASGKVGIGTTSPTSPLMIAGSGADGTAMLRLEGTGGTQTFNWISSVVYPNMTADKTIIKLFGRGQATNNQAWIGFKYAGDGSTSNQLSLGFYANNFLFNVKATGNVGIGTESPGQKLEVAGRIRVTTDPTLEVYEASDKRGGFQWDSTNDYVNIFSTGGDMRFDLGGERMRITSGGNVGIGYTNPGSKLSVNGDGGFVSNSSSRVLYLTQNATNAGNIIQFLDQSGNNVWELVGRNSSFYIYNNQNSVGYVLESNASNGHIAILKGGTDASYPLDVTGTIRSTADVIAYSDRRVKENIKTIDNALDKVTKLRGVSYNRKDIEDKSTKIGVIAQEVKDILPEVVDQDRDDKYSVAYGNMAGLFIEAIKELKAEIEELKSNKCNCNK